MGGEGEGGKVGRWKGGEGGQGKREEGEGWAVVGWWTIVR